MYKPYQGAKAIEASPETEAMFKWAAELGVKWPKIVYPVYFPPGYIGSMATEEIFPGERIVSAPNKALFTSKVAQDSELKPVFEQCGENFNRSMLVLVTYLIWEKFKGESSRWAPFIKYQPQNPSNVQDWLPEELAELQDADLVCDVIFYLDS